MGDEGMSRVCVGLRTGESCSLSGGMRLQTDRGPIKVDNLKKLWLNDFFEWVELPTVMRVTQAPDNEWEEPESEDVIGELTVVADGIVYVAEERGDE